MFGKNLWNVQEIKIERSIFKKRMFDFLAIAAMAFFYSTGICKNSY